MSGIISFGDALKLRGSYGPYTWGVTADIPCIGEGSTAHYSYALPNPAASYGLSIISGTLQQNFELQDFVLSPRFSGLDYNVVIDASMNNNTSTTEDGQSSLPIRIESAKGSHVISQPGYSLTYHQQYNDFDLTATLNQDFGFVNNGSFFLRNTVDVKGLQEIKFSPTYAVQGTVHLQGGYTIGRQPGDSSNYVSMLDGFLLGPELVRGIAPSSMGPRDLNPIEKNDAISGTKYVAASLEALVPIKILHPKMGDMTFSTYLDTGSLWDYQGDTFWPQTGETLIFTSSGLFPLRASVGVGFTWDFPLCPVSGNLSKVFQYDPEDRLLLFNYRFSGRLKF
jgi:outer membrane protein insertion porin family